VLITRPHDDIREKTKNKKRKKGIFELQMARQAVVGKLKPQPSTDDENYSAADSVHKDVVEDDKTPSPAGSECNDRQLAGLRKKLQQWEKEVQKSWNLCFT